MTEEFRMPNIRPPSWDNMGKSDFEKASPGQRVLMYLYFMGGDLADDFVLREVEKARAEKDLVEKS